MPETKNQSVANYRDELLKQAQSRYPDRDFYGETDENGEKPLNVEALQQAIYEMLSEKDSKISESDSANQALTELFLNDPESAEFIDSWMRTGDPREALVETFGDSLSDLGTEEGRTRFGESLGKWRERNRKNAQLDEEADRNWEQSLADLDSWGNEKGMDNDAKVQVITRLIKIAADGVMNKYSPEDFELVLKDMNYDSEIKKAREDGLVAGRNERIEAAKRARNDASSMPPALSGQRTPVREVAPKKDDNPFRGIR